MEYGLAGFIAFIIFASIYLIFNKVIFKKIHNGPVVPLPLLFFLALGCGIYLIARFLDGKDYALAEIYFFTAQIVLGIILARIIVSLLYLFDSDLELMNKLRSMKMKSRVKYSRFFNVYSFGVILEFMLSFSVYAVVCWWCGTEFEFVLDGCVSIFARITFFILLYMFLDKKHHYVMQTLKLCSKKYIFIAVIAGVGMYFITWFVRNCNFYYITEIIGIPSVMKSLSEGCREVIPNSISFYILTFISVVIVAPVVEELFFRGFIYTSIKRHCGITKAIIISTALFALIHVDVYYRFIPIIIAGLVLPYIYEKSRSLIAPIIVHAVYNFIVMF